MDLNLIILFLVGICIVFADKIDEATQSNGKMKKSNLCFRCGCAFD